MFAPLTLGNLSLGQHMSAHVLESFFMLSAFVYGAIYLHIASSSYHFIQLLHVGVVSADKDFRSRVEISCCRGIIVESQASITPPLVA